ncbi:DUF2796 domain-containing protein [Piscinibacter sp.]|uniref:DUF2796 domain-containing protein n=1 Tax=Piscinibacter sp. TaxID=1903157 RepID=UPI0039E4E425
MLEPSPRRRAGIRAVATLIGALTVALPVAAQQHAHTHGRMALDAAIDAQTITLSIESPLDGLLGFERAPRSDAERRRVADMVARLKAADGLFQPDPAAGCTLSKVELDSAVLGLGEAQAHGHGAADGEHADIDVTVVFTCAKATEARFIDVKLFDAFKRVRVVDAQVASPQGQFKRSLKPGASRLSLAR